MKGIWQDYLVVAVIILSLATTFMTRYSGIAKIRALGLEEEAAQAIRQLEKNPIMRAALDLSFLFEIVSVIGAGISLGGYVIARRTTLKINTERAWMMFDIVVILVSYVLIHNFIHDLPSFLQWVVLA